MRKHREEIEDISTSIDTMLMGKNNNERKHPTMDSPLTTCMNPPTSDRMQALNE